MNFPPTPEQSDILSAARESDKSLMITAYAGTGKTTTLTMLAEALPPIPSLALAFNRKIKEELAKRFPSNFHVKTMNGLGHSAWRAILSKPITLDDRKVGKIIGELAKAESLELGEDGWGEIRSLVTAAMNAGLVPSIFPKPGLVVDSPEAWTDLALESDCSPDWISFAREVLITSIRMGFGQNLSSAVISYDDQIYLPTLLGGRFPSYPLVMVDEAQDLSPLQHLMVKKVASKRLIVVGDPKQAIYAFRGADSSSMEKLRALRQDWTDLPLSVTFRCPKVVVERQQEHAPGYSAAESNTEGEVIDLRDNPEGWTWDDVPQDGSVAVLCRLNAPLVSMALKLLSRKIRCVMLGRDLGKGLTALAKKLLPSKDLSPETCRDLINRWREEESNLMRINEKPHKIAAIDDKADCLLAVLEVCTTSGDLFRTLREIFEQTSGTVELASGHKAKGLEWSTVVHLNPELIPSHFAKKAAVEGNKKQLRQEENLRYVIETRTQRTFVLASLKEFS